MQVVVGLWGKKIGMTQLFANDKVIPVTVIDLARWIVIDKKTELRDGYNAIRVGYVRDRYAQEPFSPEWRKKLKQYFRLVKEIRTDRVDQIEEGVLLDVSQIFTEQDFVDISGRTKGAGFAGVIRRHGFSGPPGSHGSMMGRRPGSIGFIRAGGKVIKGKKLPGRMGNESCMMKNLAIVKIDPVAHLLVVKGSVPGKSNSFVFMRKV